MHAVHAGVAVVLAMTILTGCTAGVTEHAGAPSVTPPAIGTPAKVTSGTKAAALPLTSYAGLAGNTDFLRAEQLLILSCMRSRGFSYTVQPVTTPSSTQQAQPYGLTSLAYAQVNGYGNGRAPAGHHLIDKKVGSLNSPAYNLALTGSASGDPSNNTEINNSCIGKADDSLSGPVRGATSDFELVGQLQQTAQNYTESDGRIVRAEHAWSRCMASHGFKFATPQAAQASAWPPAPSAQEIATAVADVRCKQQVNLVGVWTAVEAGYQRELIAQHSAVLAALAKDLNAEEREASAIIARHGSSA